MSRFILIAMPFNRRFKPLTSAVLGLLLLMPSGLFHNDRSMAAGLPVNSTPSHSLKKPLSIVALPKPTFLAQSFNSGTVMPYTRPAVTALPALQGKIAIQGNVEVGQDRKVSLNLRDANLRDVLNMLAQQGHFNLILDDSVDGTLTIDIKNISIGKALGYVFQVAGLDYSKDGNTIIVATQAAANTKNLNVQTFTTIPVYYKDAAAVATQLNQTLFSVSRLGGSSRAIASSDPDTNSILLMGTDKDIALVKQALKGLDIPIKRKVYQVRHNTPAYVAQVLAANFFGLGRSGSTASSGAGAASPAASSSGASTPSTGGGGASTASSTSAAPAAASSSSGSSSGSSGSGLVFRSGGVTFIVEPISSTLTVMGTLQQLALIDSLIDQVDIRRPQVAIELSLVEVQKSGIKSLIPQFGTAQFGQFNLSLLPAGGDAPNAFNFARRGGLTTPKAPYFTTFGVQALDTMLKGKILANPNVVALDGTSSTINITDEVPTIVQTTTITATGPVIATSIQKQAAGITMVVTPTVSTDGSVTLSMNPQVSQPLRQISVSGASTFLLSTRSVSLAAVRVKDGQTLVIGGLLRETNSVDLRKVPGIADLPIVGAMFRATANDSKDRTELILMVTPHILKEANTAYDPAVAASNSDVPATMTPAWNPTPGAVLNNAPILNNGPNNSPYSPPVSLPVTVPSAHRAGVLSPLARFLPSKKVATPYAMNMPQSTGLPGNLPPMDDIIK